MQLAEFFADPGRAQMYRQWRADERTKVILDSLRETVLPAGLPPAQRTGEHALYYAGFTDGCQVAVTALCDLETTLALLAKQREELRKLVPDYGALRLIDQES